MKPKPMHPRAKGSGGIYKPKASRFWWISYTSGGKRRFESSGSTRRGDAQKRLTERLGDIGRGIEVTPQIGRKTIGDGLWAVIHDQQLNGRRAIADTERRITQHLLTYFHPDRRLATLTTSDLTAYTVHRRHEVTRRCPQGASVKSCNEELGLLKRAFKLALRGKELITMPYIPMAEVHNVRQGFFERDQFEGVRAALPEALRGIATLAYYTGWRKGELLPLLWTQVDRRAHTIRLEPGTTKNDEARTLPYDLLPELVTVIETAWQAHEQLLAAGTICPFVFHRHGRPVRSYQKAWNTACRVAGCPGKIVHDFRRTAVRNLVRAGVPEKTAMQITGHKTRSVFDRYNIVNGADVRRALGQLATAEPGAAISSTVERFPAR